MRAKRKTKPYNRRSTDPPTSARASPKPTKESPLPAKASLLPTKASPIPTKASPIPAKAFQIPAKASPIPTKASPIPARASPTPAKASPIPIKTLLIPAKASPITIKTLPISAKASPIPDNALAISVKVSTTPAKELITMTNIDFNTPTKRNDNTNTIDICDRATAALATNKVYKYKEQKTIETKPQTLSKPNLNENPKTIKEIKTCIPTTQANKSKIPNSFLIKKILRIARNADIFNTTKKHKVVLNGNGKIVTNDLNHKNSTINSGTKLQRHPEKQGGTQIAIEEDYKEPYKIENNFENTETDNSEEKIEKLYNTWLNETGITMPDNTWLNETGITMPDNTWLNYTGITIPCKNNKVGKFEKRISVLLKLAETINGKESQELKSLRLYQLAFNHVCEKIKISQDQLTILYSHGIKRPSQVEELKVKRNKLINEIKNKSNNFKEMLKYENERLQSDTKTENLEEYLYMMVDSVVSEIRAISQELESMNEEMNEVNKLITQGKNKVAELKATLRKMKDVKQCNEYKEMLQKNKRIKAELQMYTKKKEDLNKKSECLINLINEDEKTEKKQNKAALKLRASMRALRINIEDNIETSYSEDNLQDMIKAIEERLKEIWRSTQSLSHKCPYNREHINQIERETDAISCENQAMLALVERLNNGYEEKVQKNKVRT